MEGTQKIRALRELSFVFSYYGRLKTSAPSSEEELPGKAGTGLGFAIYSANCQE